MIRARTHLLDSDFNSLHSHTGIKVRQKTIGIFVCNSSENVQIAVVSWRSLSAYHGMDNRQKLALILPACCVLCLLSVIHSLSLSLVDVSSSVRFSAFFIFNFLFSIIPSSTSVSHLPLSSPLLYLLFLFACPSILTFYISILVPSFLSNSHTDFHVTFPPSVGTPPMHWAQHRNLAMQFNQHVRELIPGECWERMCACMLTCALHGHWLVGQENCR